MTRACHIIFERWSPSIQMNGISFAASFQIRSDHENVHWFMKCLLTLPPCINAVPAFCHSWVLWPKLLGQRHYMCPLILRNIFIKLYSHRDFPIKTEINRMKKMVSLWSPPTPPPNLIFVWNQVLFCVFCLDTWYKISVKSVIIFMVVFICL